MFILFKAGVYDYSDSIIEGPTKYIKMRSHSTGRTGTTRSITKYFGIGRAVLFR